jgi:hypothetical protein
MTFDNIKEIMQTIVDFVKQFAKELKGFISKFGKDIVIKPDVTTNPVIEPNTVEA